MRNYRRMAARKARGSGGQDFWLSFSDLMSVLVLVFILVLFYVLYKYFIILGAYEQEIANLQVVQADLDERERELESTRAQLTSREEELAASQAELDAAEAELEETEAALDLKQAELDEAEAALDLKQSELDETTALLDEREAELEDMELRLADQEVRLDEQEARLADQEARLDEQEAMLEALVGVRSRIIEEMSASFRANGISATVDPETGDIIFESDVMFEYGSATLSDQGKAFIDAFLPVYLDVLLSDENAGYVAEIIIEGHTDTTDTYIKNMALSQDRAFAVVEYILSDEFTYLTPGQKIQFMGLLTANGRSYSDPILDEHGNVDAAASRRVVFKFRLKDDEMIQQMQEILGGL